MADSMNGGCDSFVLDTEGRRPAIRPHSHPDATKPAREPQDMRPEAGFETGVSAAGQAGETSMVTGNCTS